MTSRTTYSVRLIGRIGPAMAQMLAVSAMALAVSACRPDEEPGAHVAGWAAIDPGQRHPIIVSQQPAHMSLRISRGATGLTSQQRANVVDFMNRYRGGDQGNGRIVVTVPSGTPNEIAALHAVAELRDMLREYAIDDSRVSVQPQRGDPEPQPPIRISYARYIAEGPSCGKWPANIADDTRNLPYHDLGCSTQSYMPDGSGGWNVTTICQAAFNANYGVG